MGEDLLRIEANERVDKSDFEFLADGAIQAEHRQVMGQLITDPTRNRGWILDGFAIDCPAGKQVRVTLGRAILGQRIGGEIKYGVLSSEGDATKIVDINAYAAGTYGVYVRFELVSGDSQSRIFWNPSGAGSEYASTIATRYNANWTLRVESGSPGAEWRQVAEVDQATLAPSANPIDVGITDKRAFYFEGSINSLAVAANFTWNGTTTIAATGADTTEMAVGDFIGFKTDGQLFEITAETPNVDLTIDNSSGLVIPAGAGADTSFVDTSSPAPYASGWSADGGSGGTTANDRKNDRSAYGAGDVQMFNAAVRQCLEDIKGRGLRRWYEREIGGMNIGFGTDPTENVLAVFDANFGLFGAAVPSLKFDAGNDEFRYDRAADKFEWEIGGVTKMELDTNALTVQASDIYAGSSSFGLVGGGANPVLRFSANDEFGYDTFANQFEWTIGGVAELILDASDLYPFGVLNLGKVGDEFANLHVVNIDATGDIELDGALTFTQADTPQRLIDTPTFPLNGITVLAKNVGGGVLTRGMLVYAANRADAWISVSPTAAVGFSVIGTVYDATIANNDFGYITVWGPGYMWIDYAGGVGGQIIGASAVSGVGEDNPTDYYVGYLPYTQGGAAVPRLVEGFITGHSKF